MDRLKDMIITGGENVYSVDVERALYAHPAVRACAVIGISDPLWVEAIHAVVVLEDGAGVTADELIDHCRRLIAGCKCPKSFTPAREYWNLLAADGAVGADESA